MREQIDARSWLKRWAKNKLKRRGGPHANMLTDVKEFDSHG
jgi:hypothetical protein